MSYKDDKYIYFYDTSIKLWTIFEVDDNGNQVSKEADYFQNKKELKKSYPTLKFTKEK